jgi:hypothetical protein
LVVLVLRVVDGAAVVEGEDVIRIELDRLVEVLDGAVVLALASVGMAAVEKGEGKIRGEPTLTAVIPESRPNRAPSNGFATVTIVSNSSVIAGSHRSVRAARLAQLTLERNLDMRCRAVTRECRVSH